jgi:probable rRNA maturation factor
MTQLELDIQAETPLDESLELLLRETVAAVLDYAHITEDAALTILLTDDEQMRQLNRDFAGLDEPTDVLSFPAAIGDELVPEELQGYLGDIAISTTKAEQQAEKGGHTPEAELQLLTVHGVLHLLGHDHSESDEKMTMWAAQKAILDSLGVQVSIPA